MTRKLTQGNEAVFRGALAAGASYYAGYPISPSTEILNIASAHAADHPEFRFLQAEDEIAQRQRHHRCLAGRREGVHRHLRARASA